MPLPFGLVCDLLDQCHQLSLAREKNTKAVIDWFARHRARIDAHDTSLPALLSTLLPERRTDRVYCIQAARLEKIIGRALFLGSSRIPELTSYKQPGLGLDLADCVQRILVTTPNPKQDATCLVTVEDIDDALHCLASTIRWSSPSIRVCQSTSAPRDRSDIEGLFRRLDAREAKWFTRLILKDYQPLIFDARLVFRLCNPLLPLVLKIQDDLTTAINVVQAIKTRLLPNSARAVSTADRILHVVKPRLGVKVGRQPWLKGRSIKNCLDNGHGRMSVEQKMDGEYCQIHFDASKGRQGVQVFSKSGKDSTEDRQALLETILNSLRVGRAGSAIRKQCILEGELVVYSDLEHKLLPFYHIRKHVSRRGRFINTEQDSQPKPYEHLMIMYYDILLLDDQSLLGVRHSARLKFLEEVICCSKGRAELVPRQVIDFGHAMGASNLRKAFAKTIVEKGEGLVLKPDDPYFCFGGERKFSGCIKLKKEYIGNFGDVGDFAVVGAGFDPATARSYQVPNLKWTHFYIGCLGNKEEVKRWGAVPEFTVVNVVELNETLLATVTTFSSFGNPTSAPLDEIATIKLNIAPGLRQHTPLRIVFTNPMVFDLRCFSFDKGGNMGFWSLRFPVVTKIHFDRDFTDTVSFEELQNMALDASRSPELEDSQENLEWIARLEAADPRGTAVDAASQLTVTTMPTPSPRLSTQNKAGSRSPASPTALRSVARAGVSLQAASGISASCTGDFAVPPPPLITPPTSSAPGRPETKPPSGDKRRKRSSPLSTAASPSAKRSRSRKTRSIQPAPPATRPSKRQGRKPLAIVDGNSSQTSATSHASFVADSYKAENKIMEPVSSPAGSFSTATTGRETSQTELRSSQTGEVTAITAPEDEDSAEGIRQTMATVVSVRTGMGGASEVISHEGKGGCLYSGARCQLAKHVVLLCPSLRERPPRLAELIEAHCLQHAVVDPVQWAREEKSRSWAGCGWETAVSKIVLVDSLVKKSEAKTLCGELDSVRDSLPASQRDWIPIYDWRILEYLRILEDSTVSRKYYDGFSDPWRRWHCGLV